MDINILYVFAGVALSLLLITLILVCRNIKLTKKMAAQNSIQTTDDDEIIAVIAAAVATMSLECGTNYTIKSVKSVSTGRPVWAAAGVAQNTRAF